MSLSDESIKNNTEAFLIVKYPPNIIIKGPEYAHGTDAIFDYLYLSADKKNNGNC